MRMKLAVLLSCLSLAVPLAISRGAAEVGRQDPGGWVCPPCGGECDQRVRETPGSCSACGMELVEESSVPSVAILLYEKVDLLSVAGPAEVLVGSRAMRVFTVADSTDPIPTQSLGELVPMRSFAETPSPDVLIIPSGRGVRDASEDELVMDWVVASAEQAERVLAIGAGGLLLAKTGLLEGHTLTSAPQLAGYIAEAGEGIDVISDRAVVESGPFTTARGAAAAFDAALGLVQALIDEETARRTAERLGLPWPIGSEGR